MKGKKKSAPKIAFEEQFSSLGDLYKSYKNCRRCNLHEECAATITKSRGTKDAAIMIIGESPGEEEWKQGIPFVGASGSFLCQAMTILNEWVDPSLEYYIEEDFDHPEVHQVIDNNFYITNAVLCWPGDRKPAKSEYNSCRDRLRNEIYLVDPILIITLGKHAAESVLGHPVAITSKHGKMYKTRIPGKSLPYIEYPVMTLVHPSFVLREGDKSEWGDLFMEALEQGLEMYHRTRDIIGEQ
jgi:uracil-DNA glycosylase